MRFGASTPEDLVEVNKKFAKSDLGAPLPGHCYPNDAYSGGVNLLTQQEVYDSSLPLGVLPPAESRFDCFRTKFTAQLATNSVPAFTYMVLANDPLLDAIAFSRGRLWVDASGTMPLILRAAAEPARSIEDCRS